MANKIDWVFLKRPMLIFTVMIIASVSFLFAGEEYRKIAEEDFNKARSSLKKSHKQLKNQSNEIAVIDEFLAKFNELENQGFIGDERRLSWIESVKSTNDELKLPEFSYSIQPQDTFERSQIKSTKKVKVLSSLMTVNLGLLHEVDLFNVIDLIDQNVSSHFTIESCDLIADKGNKELKVDDDNIRAQCDVRWINLKITEK